VVLGDTLWSESVCRAKVIDGIIGLSIGANRVPVIALRNENVVPDGPGGPQAARYVPLSFWLSLRDVVEWARQ
jgi:hypothetical protein